MTSNFILALLFLATYASAKSQSTPTGFTCTAPEEPTRRLNIDLRRGRYDAGDGSKRLAQVTDTIVTIEGPNPDLMTNPVAPVLRTLTLDRTTLVLTDTTLILDRNVSRTTISQCAMGPVIDFHPGRRS